SAWTRRSRCRGSYARFPAHASSRRRVKRRCVRLQSRPTMPADSRGASRPCGSAVRCNRRARIFGTRIPRRTISREECMCPVSLRMAAPGSAALIAALISCCACGYAETLDELYARAKAEKSLVIYAGGPVMNYEPLAREFESKFPGLTVSIEGGFSNVLNQKIEQQFARQNLQADMVLFQTAQDFVRWKGQGKLLAFKPEGFDAIDKSFKDPDGAFIVWYVGTLSYAYNTRQV